MTAAKVRTKTPDAPTEEAVIATLWNYHIGIVQTAVAPHSYLNGDDFARSIQFLEKVTGIYSDTRNWAGRIPTAELPHSLKLWEEWYERHRSELRLSYVGCDPIIQQAKTP